MEYTTAKRKMAELLWMLHYNRVLLKQGLITVEEYRSMESMIRARKSTAAIERELQARPSISR